MFKRSNARARGKLTGSQVRFRISVSGLLADVARYHWALRPEARLSLLNVWIPILAVNGAPKINSALQKRWRIVRANVIDATSAGGLTNNIQVSPTAFYEGVLMSAVIGAKTKGAT